jgi:hypothetical protein
MDDTSMQIDALTPGAITMGGIERAHASLNAAYNAIATDRLPETLVRDCGLARDYVTEARQELQPASGHDGPDGALAAARAVLPRLERALQLLDELQTTHDVEHVAPLLDELGIAMDHVEQALGSVGWD